MVCPKCNTKLPEEALFCFACGKKQNAQQRKYKRRANGTGSISKLSGNRKRPWQARKSGIPIGTFATRAEAQKALDRLVDADVTANFNLSFKDVHDLWLPEHMRDIGESAKGNYKTAMNHCSSLHDRRFRGLRTSDFQKVIIEMEEKGLSKSSCEKVLQLFGQLSEYAIREGICQVNYARFCTIAARQKSEGKVFPSQSIHAIESGDHLAADIVMVLLATGCRGNELFLAPLEQCADLYFVGGSKTEAGKNRPIAVAPYGLAAYKRLLESAKAAGGPYLISGYKGNQTYSNFAKREFKDLMKQLGLEGYTPYDCRHTFTTMAVKAKMDKQLLKRVIGHADLNTTDKYYTHLDLDDILAAASALVLQ